MALKKEARNKVDGPQTSKSVKDGEKGASGGKKGLKTAAFDKQVEKKSPAKTIQDDTKSLGKVKDAKSLPRTPKFK